VDELRGSVVAALRRHGVEDVDDSALGRILYSSDASLYRVPPLVVVRPRHRDEVEAVLAACREHRVPVTARGAGTSIAGNAVGPGVVLDHSRHLGRVLSVDADARTAVVEPGAVHARLQAAAGRHGLRFGPDPSTHTRCTVGGMVGNNACGARALGYGRTSDNVLGLDVLTGSGQRLHLAVPGETGPGPRLAPPVPDVVRAARSVVSAHLGTVRTEFGRFGRQVSGYALEHLLPERGGDLTRTLVGSEGTLALVEEVTVRLVPEEGQRLLVLLGFPDIATAADAAPATLALRPTACEGLDRRLLDPLVRAGRQRSSTFPAGDGLLLVELAGDDRAELRDRAERLLRAVPTREARVVDDPREAAAVWAVREDTAGIAARMPDGAPAHAGWEDAAVPVGRLGGYLRAFEGLLREHGLHAIPYGHFGDGCVHVRIDFPLDGGRSDGQHVYRRFVEDAAALVAAHGGSLSGEHGDGRARSGLLGAMYSPEALAVQAELKRLLDPEGLLNPGVLVAPDAPDAHLRASGRTPVTLRRAPALAGDAAALAGEAHRCTGVAKCVATASDGVMCPSYRATREEKDSTRGRARVLQELAQGGSGLDWDSREVADALDLCLGCKACARDCPTGVDLARLRAEALHQRRRTGRPRVADLALGRLPHWADVAARAPRLTAAVTRGPLRPVVARVAGIDPRRTLPAFAPATFLGRRRDDAGAAPEGAASAAGAPAGPVVLWVDTFTDHFAPEVAEAAVRVLGAAGYRVRVVEEPLCCGLTDIATGALERARDALGPTVAALADAVSDGAPLVGLEPSCLTVLRDDALHLLPGDAGARRVAAAARPLARLLLDTPGWSPPDLSGTGVVAQPHCHEHATTGWTAEEELLRRSGADLTVVRGCCGLAGGWGLERGHHDVSVAIAELALLPAVRSLGADGVVCADGFSCRTQVADLAGRRSLHLAELLDGAGQR
jgi:FAD/FMN-containing dehydrogenase/Fe-S oxidoreductase